MSLRITVNKVADFAGQLQHDPRFSDRITDTTKDGRECVKFVLKDGDSWNGSHRCEAVIRGKLPDQPFYQAEGQELWVAFGLWLPEFPYRDNDTLMQFRGFPEDTFKHCGFYFGTDGKVAFTGSSWRWLVKGKWTEWLLRVKVSSKAAGQVECWIDGQHQFISTGLTTTGAQQGYLKAGIYGVNKSSTATRSRYFHKLRVGTAKSDVSTPAPVPPKYSITCPVCSTRFSTP